MTDDVQRAVDAIWRIESARTIAQLTAFTGDVGVAEDLAQEAILAALERWPRDGIPDNPGAWLTSTAKNRAIDGFRRAENLARKQEELVTERGHRLEADATRVGIEAPGEDGELLRLIFTTCHPALKPEAQVALTLKLVGGLGSEEIARAFLTTKATVDQRIVRAKRALRDSDVQFRLPDDEELDARLGAVLGVLYLIFNEGYSASAGDDYLRPELCGDALRITRMLAAIAPREPEVLGLLALMELQSSRAAARVGRDGSLVLLDQQDRRRWDRSAINRGLAALARSERLPKPLGSYGLQAEIAACHARALSPEETDWIKIAALYSVLSAVEPTPVVAVNRAVAVGRAFGPEEGLELLDREGDALDAYYPAHAVRADLLLRSGRRREAAGEFEHAAALTANSSERELLLRRARAAAASEASS